MVTWTADGTLSGYDGVLGRLKADRYKFVTPGTVDINGSTRFGRAIFNADGSHAGAYGGLTPNYLSATATYSYTAADFNANPGKQLGPALYVAPASSFAEGVVPTPQQIVDANWGFPSRGSSWGPRSPGSAAPSTLLPMAGYYGPSLPKNTKLWVALIPSAWLYTSNPSVHANTRPMVGIAVNTLGRALSVWTDRTPAAPVITAPISGAVLAPGAVTSFAYTTSDPDAVTPLDPAKRNADVAGVQVQYAAIATPANPTPTWNDLPFSTDSYMATAVCFRGGIDPDLLRIIEDSGFPLTASTETPPDFSGILPGGDWQIRMRTFDFGHPYPNAFYALGDAPEGSPVRDYQPSSFPAENISPWSVSVNISVPVQVPPPIPLTPIKDLARSEGAPVRLGWQYRNTFRPPFMQRRRWVQIRKVGDLAWSTVAAGLGAEPFIDLLPATIGVVVADHQYQPDLGFEANTLGGWSVTDLTAFVDVPSLPNPGPFTLANVNSVPNSHSGSRHLAISQSGSSPADPAFFRRYTDIDPAHDEFSFSAWIYPLAATDVIQVVLVWLTPAGDYYYEDDGVTIQPKTQGVGVVLRPGGGWPGWVELTGTLPEGRPADATTLMALIAPNTVPNTANSGTRLDDVSLLGHSTTGTDDFTLEATTHYEWRVRVEDEDYEQSDYSQVGLFWVVPGAGTGEVRPLPSGTIEGATLGCGKHRAEVFRRGGKRRVGEIRKISYVDWERVRDDISTAKIIVKDWDIDCGNLLASLQTWAYEIVIYRNDGASEHRVWEGPITLLTYEQDAVTIDVKDVMAYGYRRIIKQAMNDNADGDTVVRRAARVLQNVFAPDDPNVLAYLQVLEREDDARQYRALPEYSRTAFEEIDDMAANSGLDYTAVGRAILLWGTKHRIGTLPEFRDEDLGSVPIVSEYGMQAANRYVVSDGNGIWGEATRLDVSGNDEVYGLIEILSSSWASDTQDDTGTYTQAGIQTMIESFEGYAERSISAKYTPPVVVRVPDNTTLSPDAPISIQDLVPGVVIPLHSVGTLRTVKASQKLDSVKVTEQDGVETIQVVMSPFSRDDASMVEDGGE